ncbi:MAG: beta-mannosidase [Rhodobacteraceae bacterium]|uniref:Beta-mannosidase n=1 Tax=Thioclava marina TaxID=1915077 RepID=A0ABX3MS62_9RHOB|nr:MULTISPECIES: glycosyl hydrolase [Thioclava]OOY13069.1 beta-mannosidase [Thioclava marina]OOY28784.1 beta-mannosidase [Thioclava sp. L04-15]TNE82689.1 MAG: beta-mannosidase [Paracoccaceae bacterium]TNF10264.1 MAG: beta-mannosidase [Paracoccaceae bacterium]
MKHHNITRRGVMAGAAALGLSLSMRQAQAAAPVEVPPGTLPFGVYDPDGDFADKTGVVIEHLFLPWEDVYLPSLNDADEYALARNRALLVTLEPWTWSRSERNTAQYLRRGIERGEYDPNMIAIAEVLATLKSPVTLRFAHEMDDKTGQFIWSDWKPDDYISAYRRMTDLAKQYAPDISLMWSPLGDENMADYYPGDEYADIIGLTVFGLQAWDKAKYGRDRTFDDIFRPRYERAAAFGKPVAVAELGYVGDQAYVDMWKNRIREEKPDYPSLVGVSYFNQIEVYPWPEGFGTPDWRIKNQVLS